MVELIYIIILVVQNNTTVVCVVAYRRKKKDGKVVIGCFCGKLRVVTKHLSLTRKCSMHGEEKDDLVGFLLVAQGMLRVLLFVVLRGHDISCRVLSKFATSYRYVSCGPFFFGDLPHHIHVPHMDFAHDAQHVL